MANKNLLKAAKSLNKSGVASEDVDLELEGKELEEAFMEAVESVSTKDEKKLDDVIVEVYNELSTKPAKGKKDDDEDDKPKKKKKDDDDDEDEKPKKKSKKDDDDDELTLKDLKDMSKKELKAVIKENKLDTDPDDYDDEDDLSDAIAKELGLTKKKKKDDDDDDDKPKKKSKKDDDDEDEKPKKKKKDDDDDEDEPKGKKGGKKAALTIQQLCMGMVIENPDADFDKLKKKVLKSLEDEDVDFSVVIEDVLNQCLDYYEFLDGEGAIK